MSQTLTKPILLDETGQAIKTALQNIDETESQDWLLGYEDVHSEMDDTLASMAESLAIIAEGGSSAKTPKEIKVTTRPDKRSYFEGETLDLTGIVVSVTYEDNTTADITGQCTFSPTNGATLTRDDTEVTASWDYHGTTFSKIYTATTPLTVTKIRVESITVVTEPTKKYYKEGEALDTTGLQVSATFNNGDVVDVTDDCVIDPADGSIVTRNTNYRVLIYYTYDGRTEGTGYNITVEYATRIEITSRADKRIYMTNEELDLTGLVVTGYININSEVRDVTDDCIYSPAEGTVLSETGTETINISYGLATTSYTVTVADEPIYSWEEGTDEQVASMLARHYDPDDDFDIHDYWNVGDYRIVHMSSMSATDISTEYPDFYVMFVLSDAGGKTLSDGVTECAFQVDQQNLYSRKTSENKIGYRGAMNLTKTNAGGWKDCARRTWCNNTYYNALPSTLKPVFKQFKNMTGKGGTDTTTEETTDYFALRSVSEIKGYQSSYSDCSTAEGEGNQTEWFETSINRKRQPMIIDNGTFDYTNVQSIIVTRSPAYDVYSYGLDRNGDAFCCISTTSQVEGTAYAEAANVDNWFICPFGVI